MKIKSHLDGSAWERNFTLNNVTLNHQLRHFSNSIGKEYLQLSSFSLQRVSKKKRLIYNIEKIRYISRVLKKYPYLILKIMRNLIFATLCIAGVITTAHSQTVVESIVFMNPTANQNFVTGHYRPLIYGSTSGGSIPSGSSSLILQAGGSASSRHIFMRTADETRLFIHYNGNVGIGTLDTDARLTVKGHIHAQEVRVDLQGSVAPDYVFTPSYRLLPLSEVKNFISEHSHLPEVPSADKMEQDGINLKEMNLLLLKKVEELTLYLIEQNEKIELQEKEIATLKKEVFTNHK
jgi:hypothetical protein